MSCILIADMPVSTEGLERILGQRHQLIVAHTIDVAREKLQQQAFDLIIVGVYFDKSQMFEFIDETKLSAQNADKPIICFSSRDTALTRILHESIERASKSAGAWMYLDQHSYNVYQDPAAELLRVFERCLSEGERREIHQRRIDIQKQRADLQQLRVMLRSQDWSSELEEYLAALKDDLEVLLKEVSKLHFSADSHRAIVTASRSLKDRVSHDVIMSENGMDRRETIQSMDETRQSIQEKVLAAEEEVLRVNKDRTKHSVYPAQTD